MPGKDDVLPGNPRFLELEGDAILGTVALDPDLAVDDVEMEKAAGPPSR